MICMAGDKGNRRKERVILSDKRSKNSRILDLYVRLCEGKAVNKREMARHFGVDERSIQRDIDDIRSFLCDRVAENAADHREITYDRKRNGFVMVGNEASLMSNSEILAVSKILLESRAFTKQEMGKILNKMIEGCVPQKNMKLVSNLIANEKYHYVELHHTSHIGDKLWEIGTHIMKRTILEIRYQRTDTSQREVKRFIEPLAIMFSEYYFYLNAYIVEQNMSGRYDRCFEYPAVFRIDRIKNYKETGDHFTLSYSSRFEEGEFRKRVQFMYVGEFMKVRIRFTGDNPEAVLDRLPTARIVSEKEREWIIDAEVYGKGIVMWLLSQGKRVEVLKPDSLRAEMKQILMEMLEKY